MMVAPRRNMILPGDDGKGFETGFDGWIIPFCEDQSDVVKIGDGYNFLLGSPGDVVLVQDGGGTAQLITIYLKFEDSGSESNLNQTDRGRVDVELPSIVHVFSYEESSHRSYPEFKAKREPVRVLSLVGFRPVLYD